MSELWEEWWFGEGACVSLERENRVCANEQGSEQFPMAHSPPAPGTLVRHSRKIVRFNAKGDGWAVRASADENSTPPHARGYTSLGEPVRSLSPILSTSARPPMTCFTQVRRPLTSLTAVEVLTKEIGELEIENARLVWGYCVSRKPTTYLSDGRPRSCSRPPLGERCTCCCGTGCTACSLASCNE